VYFIHFFCKRLLELCAQQQLPDDNMGFAIMSNQGQSDLAFSRIAWYAYSRILGITPAYPTVAEAAAWTWPDFCAAINRRSKLFIQICVNGGASAPATPTFTNADYVGSYINAAFGSAVININGAGAVCAAASPLCVTILSAIVLSVNPIAGGSSGAFCVFSAIVLAFVGATLQ
jgi:hypothetical protein